jgi:serine/threonine-protein kinase
LAAFQSGLLAEPDLERLAEHLGRCAACASSLGGMAEDPLAARLRGATPPPEDAELRRLEAFALGLSPQAVAATVTEQHTPFQAAHAEDELPSSFGAYKLLERLGKGGMGVVWKAHHGPLNRVVALKMLPAGSESDEEALTRFCVEAEAIARLKHPNVVQVHDFNSHEGRLYLVMEYLEGGTLAQRLSKGPLPLREAAALVTQVARAVDAAHGQNVVHRDLKPSNVLLAADGTAKIADFGLAKLLDETGEGQTRDQQVLGTTQYMAPEQAHGHTREAGPPADIWALGVILYECLTGLVPFKADSRQATLRLVRSAEPRLPSRLRRDVPRELEAVCLKCLEKDPRRRYPSARGLAEDLERWLGGGAPHVRPDNPVQRAARSLRRQRRRVALTGLVLLLAILAPAAWLLRRPSPEQVLRQIEAALARGETVTLLGETGMPRWSEWVPGGDSGMLVGSPDKPLEVSSSPAARLALVRDPQVEHFVLRGEIRHDHVDPGGFVGLFVCHDEQQTSQGLVHCFTRLHFDDVDDVKARWRELNSKGVMQPWDKEPEGSYAALGPTFQPAVMIRFQRYWEWPMAATFSRPFAPAGFEGARWRTVEIEVWPDGVRGSFDGDPLKPLSAAEILRAAGRKLNEKAGLPEGAVARELIPRYVPRGRVGLYVCSSKAAFRNVVLKPLSGSP